MAIQNLERRASHSDSTSRTPTVSSLPQRVVVVMVDASSPTGRALNGVTGAARRLRELSRRHDCSPSRRRNDASPPRGKWLDSGALSGGAIESPVRVAIRAGDILVATEGRIPSARNIRRDAGTLTRGCSSFISPRRLGESLRCGSSRPGWSSRRTRAGLSRYDAKEHTLVTTAQSTAERPAPATDTQTVDLLGCPPHGWGITVRIGMTLLRSLRQRGPDRLQVRGAQGARGFAGFARGSEVHGVARFACRSAGLSATTGLIALSGRNRLRGFRQSVD